MFFLFLKIYLLHFLIVPLGTYFISKKENNYITYSTQLIYGIILISFSALLLNFFLPLNNTINSITILFLLTFIYRHLKNFFLDIEFYIFCFLSTLIISLLIIGSNVYRPDAGLYHLPYINILNNEKIIIGLSNLHFRYAHASILQHTSAILNNFVIGINGIVLPSALIFSAILVNFISRTFNLIKLNKYNIEFYFLIFVQIFMFYKMNRYSEYGNDTPSHLLFFYLLSLILKNQFNIKEVLNTFLLILFIILNKIILILSFFFIFLFLDKIKIFDFLKYKRFYFISIFFTIWVIKNLLISGCLIFPVTSLCFDNFKWSNKSLSKNVSIENEAWAKGWPDYINKSKKNDKLLKIDQYSKNFNWVSTWSSKHFLFMINIISIYLLLSLIVFFIFFRLKKNKFEKNLDINKHILITISILIIFNIIWLIKLPVFRYGYSYNIALIATLFSFIGLKFFKQKNNYKKKYLVILSICLCVFTVKNINRINNIELNYTNYPWPKFYSMNNKNDYPILNEFYISEKKFYKPANNEYCMYFKSPCVNYGNYLNANLQKSLSYNVVYLDK